jgi:retron-type reverse transcriptase
MVVILRPQDDANVILERISQFLAERGMNVSGKKTKLTAATDGFDFLGWHIRVQTNGKLRCVPSEDNFKAFRQKVKDIVNCSNYGSEVKAKKLAPIVRGWRNYHRRKQDGWSKKCATSHGMQNSQSIQQGIKAKPLYQ